MGWQAWIAISILFESFGRIMQRTIMRENRSDPISSAILYQLIAGVALGILCLFIEFKIPSDIAPLIPFLIAAPFLWGITNILIFKSLKTTEASVFTIIFTSRTVFIILLSILLLGETFSLKQAFGTGLIFFAIVVISWKSERLSVKIGEILALLAASSLAVASINDSYISRSLPVIPYLAYNFFFSGLVVLLLNPRSGSGIGKLIKNGKEFSKLVVLAVMLAGSATTAILAYQVGRNAAQIGAIYPISGILTVILAIFILKEKDDLWKKILAVGISFLGVLLVG